MENKNHWEKVYQTKLPTAVSWYQPHLQKSLDIIVRTGISHEAAIIDVGGGASTLADDLLLQGFKDITALDISKEALERSKVRLGSKSSKISWLEADITKVNFPKGKYDLWHDRAVFHFLTKKSDRIQYVKTLHHSVKQGGHVIIATFGSKGPEKCSGLDVVRYGLEEMKKVIGNSFELVESLEESHKTPFETVQEFMYFWFKRTKH